MNLSVKIVQILLFICLQSGLFHAEPLLKDVRNFVEEATKGLNLVNLSNYAVDFAHLNGHLLINKEQFEAEIAEQEAACSSEGKPAAEDDEEFSNGSEQLKKQKHDKMNEEGKRLKPVDPNQLSNHHSVTYSTTLLPSPYPRELFLLAVEIQPLMAEVHFRA